MTTAKTLTLVLFGVFFIGAGANHFINPDFYAVGELIPLGSTRLPNLGGGERGYVDWTGTLKVAHPAAHGKITVLS